MSRFIRMVRGTKPAKPVTPEVPAVTTTTTVATSAASGHRVIHLDYPVHPRPRYGTTWGLGAHGPLTALMESSRVAAGEALAAIASFSEQLAQIPKEFRGDVLEPYWVNGWLPGLDGAALYGFVASRQPATYLEVGSGNSTKFARRAITDHSLSTRVVSIDPMPRAECDELCHEIVRQPLEDIDLSIFDRLVAGDVLFIDNSHRALQNSDVTVALLEVIGRLAPGVLVGIHDIFLPDDYPIEWADRFYSEQYLLSAWLLGGHGGSQLVLPSWWAAKHTDLCAALQPLWESVGVIETHGNAFWFETI
jgi:Methyltransferase domain